ncbi:alpha/beta hydrolase [Blastopirellula marina]|uniref:Serine aminopeptidase S33 domain-containing protein n=1 Tax=Blastopirellula marina TaxID=124 RepID=A0A2S8G9K7_9BACT|nr:alpha/beta hydrolase [Blastopirellula marina]PQO40990.1 hypothetical protein C5Y98_05270 [Blastopirellula marina]PTL45873.1 hypothetical protein C5Y97_05270 [Blastopirellula marina]
MRLLKLSLVVALCAFTAWHTPAVQAQPPAAPKPAAPKPAPKPAGARKEIPPPEAISRTTKDGVIIHGTYYGSADGKMAIPVIMLPGWERSQNDLTGLAKIMQREGLAVVTVDLRGHGASKTIQGAGGQVTEIDLERIRANDFETFVAQDLEAIKSFLMEENNKGNLNIEMLTIVGCDFSAIAALNFAARDWSWPTLPTLKQGQDVKGLILVSPPKTFKGFNANQALKMPVIQNELSIMIIASEGNRSDFSDAKRVFNSLDKIRQKRMDDSSDRTIFFAAKPGDLSGTALLADPRSNCLKDILFFTKTHLAELQANDPWHDRSTPLD